MLNSRLARIFALSFVLVLLVAMTPVAVTAQVTVNAPKGLLNREKGTSAKEKDKEKSKAQEPAGGEASTTSPAESQHSQPVKSQPRKKRVLSNDERKNYRFSNQTVTKRTGGFRVQVLFSSNKNARSVAQARAKEIALKFPQYRFYISYNAPQWRLRVGDFTSRESAGKALRRIRRAFRAYGSEMIVVRDNINVWENY